MFRASDLKKGDVVRIEGDAHIVETIKVQSPSARGAVTLYKIRFRNLKSKRKIDQALRGDDVLAEADFERRPVQFLFGDASSITFMDLQDYSQFTLMKDEIEEEWPYLTEGIDGLISISSEGRVLGLEIPTFIELEIVETMPSVKGGSVTARTKPATLSTGLVVQVPEYMSSGEVIRVDTRTGEYVSKA
ncbi:MAG TPA: elongation factor P-like protein YeiP [Candidatus Latescibacteria bacterium]|nr:elongation factor P-like protein YeiP [Candidatus Latescibacterota bacterium]